VTCAVADGHSERAGDEGGGIGVVSHDADPFTVEAFFDVGDPQAAPSDAGTYRVDTGDAGPHSDFGASTGIACDGDDFDEVVGELGDAGVQGRAQGAGRHGRSFGVGGVAGLGVP